jgi:6-phosphogluconolactonase
MNPQHAPFARMTLTLPTLLQSKQIILLLTGDEKRQIYNCALEKGPVSELPIRSILHQSKTPVAVYWSQ